ncbi:MAG TPA: hypothetical protein VJ810_31875, partial [Blastocatellia bacterium]|nr:hypothetical protein [Blastocatellia bacterium]
MKDSDSNKLLIFLLAALAIYFPLSSIPSPPDQQSSGQQQLPSFIQIPPHESPTPAPTPLEGRVPGEAAKLLCDFFGLQPDLDQHGQGRNSGEEQTQPNAIQNFDSKKLKCDYCGIKAILNSSKREHPAVADYKNNIEYLIATVPDPKDSRLDHMFDRYLDVIERAIERADYTFDSYWLPWDRSKAPATIVLSSDTKTPQMATATRHLYEPGVILFRYNERPSRASNSDNEGPSLASNSDNEGPSRASNSDNNEPSSGRNKLLLLFLVGESPTGGIHRGAFKNALLQIEEIAGWRKSKTERADKEAAEKESRIMTQFLSGSETEKADEKAADKELRVISPCFSGSEESLVILLKEWIHKYQKPPRVRIISGTVTSMDKCHFLGRIGSDNVSFYSTVVESRQVTEKFYDYLRDLDSSIDRSGDGPRIALLSDAITTSGQRARNPLSDAIMTSGQRAREPQCENRHTADGARPRQPRDLDLTFPLHISQLRVEASKRANLREDPTNVLAVKEPDLELPMREAGSPVSKDIVPLFSPVETVTMDLTLDEMLSAIHREGIRYVGVRAIDVQDRIYLVREIRKHCPNAMIFIYNNDLLYLHSDSNLDFRGALVISTYPIFGLNQLWTYPFKGDRRRLQFSTQNTQGLYNATLALLDKKDRMLEYGLPFHIYQKGDQRYPAIWLGIVGSDGIWPVKTFDPFPDKKPSEKYSYTLLIPSNSSGADVPTDVKEPPSGLGLNRIYWSPTGNGTLLLIGTIFLLLAFVYLAQLSFFRGRSQTDQADSAQPRPLPWIRRGLLGKVFGDEDFFCYCQDRRINLMSSFVCL